MNSLQPCASPLRRIWRSLATATLVALASAGVARAAAYMKFDGIDGESATPRLEKWSEVRAVGSEVTRTPGTTPSFTLTVRKRIDKASPLLAKACGDGSVLPQMSLVFTEGSAVGQRVTLRLVQVGSVKVGIEEGETELGEELTLTYQKIEWTWRELDAKGGPLGGIAGVYDLPSTQSSIRELLPFRATIAPGPNGRGFRLSCPVEAGRRYRIVASSGLDGAWQPVVEFTAETDGQHVQDIAPAALPAAFLRFEEVSQ